MREDISGCACLVQIAEAIHDQDHLRILLYEDDEAHVVFIKETFRHIDGVVIRIVNVHSIALCMQMLHHPNFVLNQDGPVRGNDKVYGALLLSQLVFRLQLVDLLSESAAVESD